MFLDIVQTLAALATAFGVFVAAWQLKHAKDQALTTFEDQLAGQYREIARRLPVRALLGEELDESGQAAALPDFYHYFDLSNEQAYLHSRGRVRRQTWEEWLDGIRTNLERPAFARAWDEITSRDRHIFEDLRKVLGSRGERAGPQRPYESLLPQSMHHPPARRIGTPP